MDLLVSLSNVSWHSFTWVDFIHALEMLLCSSPLLIDQAGVYVSALKIDF